MIAVGQRVKWIPISPCEGTITDVYEVEDHGGQLMPGPFFSVKWDDGKSNHQYSQDGIDEGSIIFLKGVIK